MALAIAGLGMLHAEIVLRVERVRRRITDTPHVDFSSVWTFAGAVLLPPAIAALVAVVVFTHLWARSWRPQVPVFRHVFSTATIVLACLAASAVVAAGGQQLPSLVGGGRTLVLLAVAGLVYTTVNSCLVAGAVAVSTPKPDLATALGDWDDVVLEMATLSLGALAALVLSINPWLVVFVLPPAAGAAPGGAGAPPQGGREHRPEDRAAQRRGLAHARPNACCTAAAPRTPRAACWCSTWTTSSGSTTPTGTSPATRCCRQWRTRCATRSATGTWSAASAARSSWCCWPPCPEPGRAELDAVAERMRRRVAGLQVEIPTPDGPMTVAGLTVSIGGAVHSRPGEDLRTLLHIADTALYSAKRAGRNRVRMGLRCPAPAQHAASDSSS